MSSTILITPEIFLSIMAFVVMLGEAFVPNRDRLWMKLSIFSLILTAVYLAAFFCFRELPFASSVGIKPLEGNGSVVQYAPVFGMLAIDSQAIFFKLSLVLATALVLGFSLNYREFKHIQGGTYSSLLLMAVVGMMFLVSSTDFLMAIISLELLGIASFILTGFVLGRRSSSEGAIKFFLVGTFSTGLFLFGVSYYYGYFGSTHLQPMWDFAATGQTPDFMFIFTLLFIIAGLGFKLAMVPFHMWAPDAYEGAPTPITAFLSVAPKAAAIGFLLRFLGDHSALGVTPVLAVVAALTMTVGNLGALRQDNMKRLLAYSSIAQVGYILVAFVAGGSLGKEAAIIYTFVYLFMNLGVFSILIIVSNAAGSDDISVFAGLSKKSLGLAVIMVVFLLSMAGIPPLAGFIGKFTIFAAVIKSPGLIWLGVVAVLNSVVSLYYYFRIAHQAFFKEPDGTPSSLGLTPTLVSCIIVTLGVTVVAGFLPNPILNWVRSVIGA